MATLVSQRLNLHLLVGYGGCLCARILAASTFDNAKEKSTEEGEGDVEEKRCEEMERGEIGQMGNNSLFTVPWSG